MAALAHLAIAVMVCAVLLSACDDDQPAGSEQTASPATAPAVESDEAPGNAQVVRLHVEGMVCGGCAEAAQETLEAIEGVQSAEVSFEAAEATVRCDPSVSPAVLVAALGNAEMNGQPMSFTAEVIDRPTPED